MVTRKKTAPEMRRELLELPPSKLIPYENNPRLNAESVDYVANSIRELGFGAPIVVDDDYVIIAGHTRLQAALKLGLESVPVLVLHGIEPEKAKAMRLADNKAGEQSGWDFAALDIELDALDGIFDMADFGFLDQKYEAFNEDEEEVHEEMPVERDGKQRFQVVVEFASEHEQTAFYEEMLNRGMVCKKG